MIILLTLFRWPDCRRSGDWAENYFLTLLMPWPTIRATLDCVLMCPIVVWMTVSTHEDFTGYRLGHKQSSEWDQTYWRDQAILDDSGLRSLNWAERSIWVVSHWDHMLHVLSYLYTQQNISKMVLATSILPKLANYECPIWVIMVNILYWPLFILTVSISVDLSFWIGRR